MERNEGERTRERERDWGRQGGADMKSSEGERDIGGDREGQTRRVTKERDRLGETGRGRQGEEQGRENEREREGGRERERLRERVGERERERVR